MKLVIPEMKNEIDRFHNASSGLADSYKYLLYYSYVTHTMKIYPVIIRLVCNTEPYTRNDISCSGNRMSAYGAINIRTYLYIARKKSEYNYLFQP